MKKQFYGKDGRNEYYACSSVDEILQVPVTNENNRSLKASYLRDRSERFNGVRGGPEKVRELVSRGWPEGTRKMREALSANTVPEVPSMRRKLRRGRTGDFVDIHRIYRGDFDRAWDRRERVVSTSQSKSHITVVCDLAIEYDAVQSEAFWRGAAAGIIVEAAIKAGRQVRVLAVGSAEDCFCDGRGDVVTSVQIKGYAQKMSIDVMAACTALVGFQRQYSWHTWFTSERPIVGHIGYPMDFPRHLLEDSSQMVWVGKDVRSQQAAQICVDSAVEMMTKRVGDNEYRRTA